MPSAKQLRGTCSTTGTPNWQSCSMAKSSMQLRMQTRGSDGGVVWVPREANRVEDAAAKLASVRLYVRSSMNGQ
ncbi:hypothetical protein ACLB2K_028994 [Fragaria x ananassa]